jgi:hypothetical protein
MKKDIPEIINTALGLDYETAKKYLIEKQIISNHSPIVFVELLRLEINNLKMISAPFISIMQETFGFNPSIHVKHKGYNIELDQLESLEKILEHLLGGTSKFENKFNDTPIELVIDHFKQLVETKNKSNEYWMTKEDFEIFIRRSFGLEKDLPKPEIKIGVTGKGKVIKLFYLFYSGSFEYGYSENNQKGLFVTLLKDAFYTDIFDNLTEKKLESRISKWPWKNLNDKIK